MTADRDSLARLIAREVECSVGWAQPVADAILASDWLAEYVRAKEKEAWREGRQTGINNQIAASSGEIISDPNPYAEALAPTAEPEPPQVPQTSVGWDPSW